MSPPAVCKVRNCQLTEDVWQIIQNEFGGPGDHTFDLMVLDSNVMKDRVTICLPLPEVRPQGPLG